MGEGEGCALNPSLLATSTVPSAPQPSQVSSQHQHQGLAALLQQQQQQQQQQQSLKRAHSPGCPDSASKVKRGLRFPL